MKNKLLSLIILISAFTNAQVAIGKNTMSSKNVSLEFGSENRGLILPWVSSTGNLTGAVNGTLAYSTADKKVYVKYASGWKDLSVDTTGVVDSSLQDTLTEKTNSKVVIGGNANSDTTPGVLVLSDSNKAMVLPKVASPHNNIVNPAPGMIVYDTTAKMLAVFNGTVWTFWKP